MSSEFGGDNSGVWVCPLCGKEVGVLSRADHLTDHPDIGDA